MRVTERLTVYEVQTSRNFQYNCISLLGTWKPKALKKMNVTGGGGGGNFVQRSNDLCNSRQLFTGDKIL